jgi:hypothetical protein
MKNIISVANNDGYGILVTGDGLIKASIGEISISQDYIIEILDLFTDPKALAVAATSENIDSRNLAKIIMEYKNAHQD